MNIAGIEAIVWRAMLYDDEFTAAFMKFFVSVNNLSIGNR